MSTFFSIPTSNTSKIVKEAKHLTRKLFVYGYEYQKIGVMLLDITDAENEQYSFYEYENYNHQTVSWRYWMALIAGMDQAH